MCYDKFIKMSYFITVTSKGEKGGTRTMEMRLRLPVGIDSFEKLRKGNYYYVDKTALIEQALEKEAK